MANRYLEKRDLRFAWRTPGRARAVLQALRPATKRAQRKTLRRAVGVHRLPKPSSLRHMHLPERRSLRSGLDLRELLEDGLMLLGRDANACIGDGAVDADLVLRL